MKRKPQGPRAAVAWNGGVVRCEQCGAGVVQPQGQGRPARFCSPRCRVAAWRAMRAQSPRPAIVNQTIGGLLDSKAPAFRVFTCADCGAVFAVKRDRRRRARLLPCPECGGRVWNEEAST